MRLDHLLSKEHLPVKAGEEPVLSACGSGVLEGGDTGQVVSATAGDQYTPPGWGCRNIVRCGWRSLLSILLGI